METFLMKAVILQWTMIIHFFLWLIVVVFQKDYSEELLKSTEHLKKRWFMGNVDIPIRWVEYIFLLSYSILKTLNLTHLFLF